MCDRRVLIIDAFLVVILNGLLERVLLHIVHNTHRYLALGKRDRDQQRIVNHILLPQKLSVIPHSLLEFLVFFPIQDQRESCEVFSEVDVHLRLPIPFFHPPVSIGRTFEIVEMHWLREAEHYIGVYQDMLHTTAPSSGVLD